MGDASEQPQQPAGPLKLEEHIGNVLTIAVGWGVVLFGYLWWQYGFSWWYPLYALGYAVVHPVVGKVWCLVLDGLYVASVRLWLRQPKFEHGVVEEMYTALFWPVIVPLAIPILLVAISMGATFRPAVRGEQGTPNQALQQTPPHDSLS